MTGKRRRKADQPRRARLTSLPPGVETLPEESRRVFDFCLGRAYSVTGIDPSGLLVLDASLDVDPRFGGFMNEIHVEQACVEDVEMPSSARRRSFSD